MQQDLRLGRHTTISDALIAALEFKAAKEASRSYKTRVRQIASKRFGKRQLVDAKERVSTTKCTQSPKISVPDKSSDAESEPGHASAGKAQSAPLCGQHDERVGLSRNKNRSVCVDVMDRLKKEFYLYSILRLRPAINC
ncbi:hypothetical protein NQ318_023424 [Aromia moschata]|uniref:Uncharacterized protein n=1 Tax=Aromia moschata TaxID=1265417 RepID=A0AAV8YW17_9CUCU|nr:hypothetical protein NQ318_023424 [Aromia moschata]